MPLNSQPNGYGRNIDVAKLMSETCVMTLNTRTQASHVCKPSKGSLHGRKYKNEAQLHSPQCPINVSCRIVCRGLRLNCTLQSQLREGWDRRLAKAPLDRWAVQADLL